MPSITQTIPSFTGGLSEQPDQLKFPGQVKDVQNTDGVLNETETGQNNNIVLNSTRIGSAITPIDEGDKILLEETGYGKFIVGETIKGETSGAEA